jgi:ABC-type multidrug transport system permease subunit
MSSGRWWGPLRQLTLVRYREFYREPEAIFWVFVFPILLTAGLGLAFRQRPPERPLIAVVSGPGAADLGQALAGTGELRVQVMDDSAAARALRSGRAALAAVAGAASAVEYRYDAERPASRTARLLADEAVQRAAGRADPVAARERLVHERGSRYVDFVVPGLLGMNLMGSGIWGLGFAIVDARRKRLLKRLIATPMPRAAFLSSFVLSRLTFLVAEVALLLGFAVLVFGVPVRGSWSTLAVICVLSALAFAALGLLIASRARTVEAASGLMNLVMLPMWICSGVFFSSSRFPDAVQPLIRALPLTAAIDALRGTMLEGTGIPGLLPELGVLAAWLVLSFLLALRLFRWQ